MAKVGRNDVCPCGSGKKYKVCCERKGREIPVRTRIVVLPLGGAIVAAVAFGLASRDENAAQGRVWSAEHGHYH